MLVHQIRKMRRSRARIAALGLVIVVLAAVACTATGTLVQPGAPGLCRLMCQPLRRLLPDGRQHRAARQRGRTGQECAARRAGTATIHPATNTCLRPIRSESWPAA